MLWRSSPRRRANEPSVRAVKRSASGKNHPSLYGTLRTAARSSGGYAAGAGEFTAGGHAIAAAILNSRGRPVAALHVSFPCGRFSPELEVRCLSTLVEGRDPSETGDAPRMTWESARMQAGDREQGEGAGACGRACPSIPPSPEKNGIQEQRSRRHKRRRPPRGDVARHDGHRIVVERCLGSCRLAFKRNECRYRPTTATDAPGSSNSTTIWRSSSSGQRRRLPLLPDLLSTTTEVDTCREVDT